MRRAGEVIGRETHAIVPEGARDVKALWAAIDVMVDPSRVKVGGQIVDISAGLSPDIDVIVPGHSHQLYVCTLRNKLVTRGVDGPLDHRHRSRHRSRHRRGHGGASVALWNSGGIRANLVGVETCQRRRLPPNLSWMGSRQRRLRRGGRVGTGTHDASFPPDDNVLAQSPLAFEGFRHRALQDFYDLCLVICSLYHGRL